MTAAFDVTDMSVLDTSAGSDPSGNVTTVDNPSDFYSETMITGDGTGNVLPVISDPGQTSSASDYSGASNVMGTVGSTALSTIDNLPAIAKSLGAAVGQAQSNINQAKANYTNARLATSTNNGLATWWQFASTTDKALVILTIVGIIVAWEK